MSSSVQHSGGPSSSLWVVLPFLWVGLLFSSLRGLVFLWVVLLFRLSFGWCSFLFRVGLLGLVLLLFLCCFLLSPMGGAGFCSSFLCGAASLSSTFGYMSAPPIEEAEEGSTTKGKRPSSPTRNGGGGTTPQLN